MDPRLQDIYNQLESVYQPQRAALQQQMPLYEQQAAANRAPLEQARSNAFRDITGTAQQRGMLFSGFTPEEQARYTGTKYLPALAGVEQTLQQRKMNLEQQLNQLNVAQRQGAQDILSKQIAEENKARQAELDRQVRLQAAMISRGGRGRGSSSGGYDNPVAPFVGQFQTWMKGQKSMPSRQAQDNFINNLFNQYGITDIGSRQVVWDAINSTFQRNPDPTKDWYYTGNPARAQQTMLRAQQIIANRGLSPALTSLLQRR